MYHLNVLKIGPPTYLLLPCHASSDLRGLQIHPVFDYASLCSSVPELLCTCTFPDFNIKLINLGQNMYYIGKGGMEDMQRISNLKRKIAAQTLPKVTNTDQQPLFAHS